jgi:peroxiredoxin
MIADENALQASLHYRRFLQSYIGNVTRPFGGFPYPSIDNTSLTNTENFYYFIHSTISQDKIADWLLSQRWLAAAGSQREYADSADFVKLYNMMQDDEVKQWFTNGYKAILKFQAGDRAPDFTLEDEYGKPCSLSQFKGKVVFITFWSSSCAPCIAEIKTCNKTVTEKYKNDPVVFVNISLDENTKKWKSAIKKYSIKGVNLMVRNGWADEVVKKYKVGAIPCHIAIDKQAIIRSYNDIRLCDIFTAQEFTKIIEQETTE